MIPPIPESEPYIEALEKQITELVLPYEIDTEKYGKIIDWLNQPFHFIMALSLKT